MRKFLDLILILIVWLILAIKCNAGDWFKWPTCTDFKNQNSVLQDIGQHYYFTRYPASTYYDADIVTWGHELTHGVNSCLRNSVGNSDTHQGVYCLDGKCMILRTPKCNLGDVRARVVYKGPDYRLYFVQQFNDWQHQPLYPLDELQAYTNGTAVGIAAGLKPRARESLTHADEFLSYAQVVLKTVKELDPGYQDLKRLEAYITYTADTLVKYHKTLE